MSTATHDTSSNLLSRFLLQRSGLRGVLVQLGEAWKTVQSRGDYPAALRDLLGEILAAAPLFTGHVKVDGRLSIQMRGEGSIRTLFAECTAAGTLRGLARWQAPLPEPLDPSHFGTDTMMVITIEGEPRPGQEPQRYQGLVGLQADRIASAFEDYFTQSEQLPTRILLAAGDPQRNIPRALIAGVTLLTIIYVATSAVFMYLVPSGLVTSDETFAAQAGEALFGGFGGQVFAAIVVVSVLGTLFAYFIASPRVSFAMANDGLFFSAFGRLHRRFGTPHSCYAYPKAIAAVLILSGSFNEILSYFFFIVILFVGLTVLGLFRIRKGSFDGYKTPFFPLTPVLFLTITAVVLFFVAMRNPVNTAIGAMVVLAGIPVYYLLFRRDQKDIE